MSDKTTVDAVGNAENYNGVCFYQWHMVVICILCLCLWRHSLTSYSCFKTNVLAKFVDMICIFFYTHFS